MKIRSLSLAAMAAALLLSACSPKFDWRDYRNLGIPYSALFPAKPATQSRNINLGDDKVSMHMAAAEIDGVTFAIGSAELRDATRAQLGITAMKNTMVKNINGAVTAEAVAADGQRTVTSVEAKGSRNGEPMVLFGRFVAKDNHVFQAIVAGREKHVNKEAVDMFLTSFKPD